jgi:hypothetical protein
MLRETSSFLLLASADFDERKKDITVQIGKGHIIVGDAG